MAEPADSLTDRVRNTIDRPIAELVEIGLEGGATAALHMLALQYINRLCLADERELLEHLRDEIDDYLEACDDDDEPPARPTLRLVN